MGWYGQGKAGQEGMKAAACNAKLGWFEVGCSTGSMEQTCKAHLAQHEKPTTKINHLLICIMLTYSMKSYAKNVPKECHELTTKSLARKCWQINILNIWVTFVLHFQV